jgi:hypothetical protein
VLVLVLELILELVARECSCERTENSMTAGLVAAKVSCGSTSQSTHQTAITLGLGVRVSGTVALLAGLAICALLTLRILAMRVGALLRELVRGLLARVLLLLLVVLAIAMC